MALQTSRKPSWRERPLPAAPMLMRPSHAQPPLQVARLNTVDYQQAWDLQRRLTQVRREDRVPDMLLLLDHPPTYTFGRAGKREHLLLTPSEMTRRGIEVYDVDRGGDITYHGPAQLVGYPILKLPRDRFTFIRFIRDLERAVLEAMRGLGVAGELKEGLSGVWVGEEKVCAIGVKVDAYGVTSHGFALNVNTDLSYFGHIVPCGIRDKGVTSMERLLGRRVSMRRVERAVIERIANAFGLEPTSRALGRNRLETVLDRAERR